MKRNERTTLNQLRRNVTADTINVEIPVDFTHEGRQAIHETLTIEKGMVAVKIYWNNIQNVYAVHYIPADGVEDLENTRRQQEIADIDAVTATLRRVDMTWNGWKKPADETPAPVEETPAPVDITDDTNYAVAYDIPGSTQDDGRTGRVIVGWFRYPFQAREFIEKVLPAETRDRFTVYPREHIEAARQRKTGRKTIATGAGYRVAFDYSDRRYYVDTHGPVVHSYSSIEAVAETLYYTGLIPVKDIGALNAATI